jgi:hypothetical protein
MTRSGDKVTTGLGPASELAIEVLARILVGLVTIAAVVVFVVVASLVVGG